MTCDICFEGRHWKCGGLCECNICALDKARKRKATKVRVRDRTGERARYYQSPLTPEQQQVKQRIGALTRFTNAEVDRIFEAKAGGRTISELARELGSTRDKVRTVYNCRVAPQLGTRPPVQRPTCPTCGHKV